MRHLLFVFSLIIIFGGLKSYGIAFNLYDNGHYWLHLFVYYIPVFGLVLMWATIYMIIRHRVKEDIRIKAITLPKVKPRYAWDPKYQISVDSIDSIDYDKESVECIHGAMESFNFKIKTDAGNAIFYERGSYFAILSINKIKLKVIIEKRRDKSLVFYTGYGNPTIDTGDLWHLTQEIINELITSVSRGRQGPRRP